MWETMERLAKIPNASGANGLPFCPEVPGGRMQISTPKTLAV